MSCFVSNILNNLFHTTLKAHYYNYMLCQYVITYWFENVSMNIQAQTFCWIVFSERQNKLRQRVLDSSIAPKLDFLFWQ